MCKVNCQNISSKPYVIPTPKVDQVFLTARSLFLNENLACHIYNYPVSWNFGSYSSNLQLTPQLLSNWKGKKILDIGGGASLFPEEAKFLLDANVTSLDINKNAIFNALQEKINVEKLVLNKQLPDSVKGQVTTNEEIIPHLYVKNLEWLYCNYRQQAKELQTTFDNIVENRNQIADTFYKNSIQRQEGDATKSTCFERNTFDVVISVWVLNYLNDEQKRQVLQNAFYWTKPQAQIRINSGTDAADGSQTGNLDSSAFKRLFEKHLITQQSTFGTSTWYVNYEGKRITVNPESSKELLILDTEPAK